MADQVIPTGGLAPGLPSALLVAAAQKPATDKPRTAKIADPQPDKQAGRPGSDSIQTRDAAVAGLNSHLQQMATGLKFQVDDATGRTVFKIVNEDSGEVLLQVPSEEVLALARNLRSLDEQMGAPGVLIDKKG